MNVKHALIFGILTVAVCMAGFGQSKKKLRDEIENQQQEIARLTTRNQQLEQKSANLQQIYESALRDKRALEEELTNLQRELNSLNQDYRELQIAYEKLIGGDNSGAVAGTTPGTGTGTGTGFDTGFDTPTTPATNPGNNNGPSRSMPCNQAGPMLTLGTTYTLEYGAVPANGYGVQIAAYQDPCQALNAASSFQRNHTQLQTYLRVKNVNGRRFYSIVYGILPSRQQASNFSDSLRRTGGPGQGQGAFVVQHN